MKMRYFTLKNLKRYNGKNEKPAYIAYNGITFLLDDYNEKSVINPRIWYRELGLEDKVKELKDIEKFIFTFPYMKNFIERAKSCNFKEIKWYPNLGIFEFEDTKIGMLITRIGAPATGIDLEELIYFGGRFFIMVGSVGVLDKEIKRGDIIIPNAAIRDEGTSYHYLPPEEETKPSEYLHKKLKKECKDRGLKFYTGKIWTTDAPYRETPTRIMKFRKDGAICVDMETSACFAVAKYYNVELAAIFYGGDYVSEESWSLRREGLAETKDIQKTLFQVVCSALKAMKL